MRVCDITEGEFLCEFARVMHEWDFRSFRRGEVSLPTLSEARAVVARSPYVRG